MKNNKGTYETAFDSGLNIGQSLNQSNRNILNDNQEKNEYSDQDKLNLSENLDMALKMFEDYGDFILSDSQLRVKVEILYGKLYEFFYSYEDDIYCLEKKKAELDENFNIFIRMFGSHSNVLHNDKELRDKVEKLYKKVDGFVLLMKNK